MPVKRVRMKTSRLASLNGRSVVQLTAGSDYDLPEAFAERLVSRGYAQPAPKRGASDAAKKKAAAAPAKKAAAAPAKAPRRQRLPRTA